MKVERQERVGGGRRVEERKIWCMVIVSCHSLLNGWQSKNNKNELQEVSTEIGFLPFER